VQRWRAGQGRASHYGKIPRFTEARNLQAIENDVSGSCVTQESRDNNALSLAREVEYSSCSQLIYFAATSRVYAKLTCD
jgi:hypothetical protein